MIYVKVFFISMLFIVNILCAEDVEYAFNISNEKPYEQEAIFLEVNLTQVDVSKVMLFKFSLKESEEYEFHQIGFKEHEKYHDLRHEYGYLIYPKKSGEVFLKFSMIKSSTDDDKVAYSISGDRDNVKGLQKEDVVVELKPLLLEVKPLPKAIDLVGDFTLIHTLDKKETEAYDPVNLSVELKGEGRLFPFELLKENEAYKIFTQSPKAKIFYSQKGSSSSLRWDYAISAKESFSLPKVNLKAFNPKTQKTYDLGFPAYFIKVNKVEVASLLDKVDYPAKSKGIDWDFWSWFFSYVVVFVAGLLMPRNLFKRKKLRIENREDILNENIKLAKSHKALLRVLLVENDVRFSKAIKALEGVVYNGEKVSLSKIKELI
ncbi:MAG: Unknown protein [uncultured Sulfurovum sp.]|uniref:BatD n=1 Tax=uncultured Sulfurovum sp. TaxID=269237 RepID=A0A6S6SJU3_9BACT|nr:MAG: Unknown protein [uncultured Sulfurovum sp.]